MSGDSTTWAISVEEATVLCAHDPEQVKHLGRIRLHADGPVDAEDPTMLFLNLIQAHLTDLHVVFSPSDSVVGDQRPKTSPRLQHIAGLYPSWKKLEALHVQINSPEDFAAVKQLLAACAGKLRNLSIAVTLPNKAVPQGLDLDTLHLPALRRLGLFVDSRAAYAAAAAIISAAEQVEELTFHSASDFNAEDIQAVVDAVERSLKRLRGLYGLPYTLLDHQYETLLNSCKTLSTFSVDLPADSRIMGVGGAEHRVELPPNPSGADYAWFEQNNVDRDPVWESPHWVRATGR